MNLNNFVKQCYEDNNGIMYDTDKLLDMVSDWEDPNPPLIVKEYDGVKVVRDDLLNHGSKIRFVDKYIRDIEAKEIVFGCCPANGYAQISLPAVASKYDKKVILFMAKRHPDNYHEYQRRGMDLGAIYEWVNMGMLNVTKSRAKKYYEEDKSNRVLFPIGLEHPTVIGSIIKVARQNLNENDFSEIWTVGSSGTLNRGLQLAFPKKDVHVVSVGHKMNEREIGRAKFYRSDYKFDKKIKEEEMPPFPSAPTYDAKAWKFVKEYAKPNALFWNVGA